MKTAATLLALSALALILPAPASAEEDWRLVARAPIIAVGIVHVPQEEVKALQADGKAGSVKLTVDVEEFLKGSAPKSPLTLTHYLGHPTASASPEFLLGMDGKKVLTFTAPDGAGGYALGKDALVPWSTEAHERFVREMARQKRILRDFSKNWDSTKVRNYKQVQKLVEKLRRSSTAEDACKQILALGPDAVPALVLMLGDDRSVAFERYELWNRSPNAFEGIFHGGIEPTVHHALLFLLGLITQEGFGGPQAETIDGWRIYLHHFDELKPALKARADEEDLPSLIAGIR